MGSRISRHLALLATRTSDIRFLRYLGASIGALVVDTLTLFTLVACGFTPATGSALGYSLGILVHWLLSSRVVFYQGIAVTGRARTVQKALFVISALAGLALTTLIVSVASQMGVDLRLAKLVAIAASFALTYLLRCHVVFR